MQTLSYTALDERLYKKCQPQYVERPEVIVFNVPLSKELGLESLSEQELARILSGHESFFGMDPIAQAYAGHQFGHFSILGDGRAHLIGEIKTPSGQLVDCMLKGSGQTAYSRGGDGLATLGPMLREYLMSEAMSKLAIPTTRSLAVVATNEVVYREQPLQGAIVARIAASHIRVGTFQYASALKDVDVLKDLAKYSIQRHFQEEINLNDNPYLAFFEAVVKRQASLIAKWISVGFIHGVMNTDNMAISGETIDYGPCAFMNYYNPKTVFSSIDTGGRYGYANQMGIGLWNLARFGETLLPIIHEDAQKALESVNGVLKTYEQEFSKAYLTEMCRKLGFGTSRQGDDQLINPLLAWMEEYQTDFTDTFKCLTLREHKRLPFSKETAFDGWYAQVQERQNHEHSSIEGIEKAMKKVNPAIIPHNHLVEEALQQATQNANLSDFHHLLNLMEDPFAYTDAQLSCLPPSVQYNRQYKTYCGT